jgi:stage II sporulation protein D
VQSVITADGNSTVNVYGSTAVTSSGTVDIEADAGALKVQGADSSSTISSTGGSGSVSAGTWVFNGKGWGHSVGMSQEGAKGFAKNGYTYDKILMHYFTGITIE